MVFQPEEDPAVPASAGDGARDGRKRLVWPPLPFETAGRDGDDLFDALPLAQQPRASDGTVAIGTDAARGDIAAIKLFAQGFQPPDRIGLQPAIGQLLDAVGQPGFKVAAVKRRRFGFEQVAPLRLQVGRRCSLQRSKARGDGVRFRHASLRWVGVA